MEKIISDLLDIIQFKFKDLNNYNYPVYILSTIFIVFIFLESALVSKVLSLGSNYKLIIGIFIKNFCQLIFVSLLLLKKFNKKFTFKEFKELLGFILLTYVITIPAMFLVMLVQNVIFSNIFVIAYFFSSLVLFVGIKYLIKINIIYLILNLILGYIILPILLLNLLLFISVNYKIISYDQVKIYGLSVKEFESKLKELNNLNDLKDFYGDKAQ